MDTQLNHLEYINVVAECCFHVFEDMTGQQAMGMSVDNINPGGPATPNQMAVVIPFKNTEQPVEGRFILGMSDLPAALTLASSIATHAGMPEIHAMDDMAMDILSEFMNTLAGEVITRWDRMGLSAEFSFPQFETDLTFDQKSGVETLTDSVTVHLAGKGKLVVLITIEEQADQPLKDKKILVVDDSKMVRYLLVKEFTAHGCLVSEAENGLEGVIKTQAVQPDLVVMDLVMPKMGGIEAMAQIRDMNSSVPIIVLTSSSKKDEVLAAAGYKVKGYIRKPIKMDRLLAVAKECFQ